MRAGEPASPFLGDNKSDYSGHSGTPVMPGRGIRIAKDDSKSPMRALGQGAIQVRMPGAEKKESKMNKVDFAAAGDKTKFFIPPFKPLDAGSINPEPSVEFPEGAFG